jgi:hypothetical protein
MWVSSQKNSSQEEKSRPEKLPAAPAAPHALSGSNAFFQFSDDPAEEPFPGRDTAPARQCSPRSAQSSGMPDAARNAAVHSRRLRPRGALCIAAYAAGLAAAGAAVAAGTQEVRDFLFYYAQNWLKLFETEEALHLFSTLFLSGVLSMTLILLLGFCTFGAPLIYLLLVLKGAGSGMLSLQLFLTYGWKGFLLYALMPAVSDVFLAWCLCALGYDGIRHSCAYFSHNIVQKTLPRCTGKAFFSRYLYLCTLQILTCGLSAVSAQFVLQYLSST